MKVIKGFPICAVLTIALSMALLWHFSNIWRYGQYLIQEPSKPILISEIVLLMICLTFGVIAFIFKLKGGADTQNND